MLRTAFWGITIVMNTRPILVTVATTAILVAVAVAQDSTDSGGKKKVEPPPEFDPALEVYYPKTAKRSSVTAVLLTHSEIRKEKLAEIRGRFLVSGMAVIEIQDQYRAWDSANSGKVIRMVEKSLGEKSAKDTKKKLLVVAIGRAGRCGLDIIDESHKRLAGAVLISVSPRTISPAAISLWAPRGEAWKLPMWVSVGTNVNGAANILLSWRRIAAVAPNDAQLTIDPRIGKGAGYVSPDKEIRKWIAALTVGKKPVKGPDRQAAAEHKYYARFARNLINALDKKTATVPGELLSKKERPMSINVAAPKGWVRFKKGERQYIDGERPYVQLYITPKVQGPLFARAMAAEFAGTGRELLADYSRRLTKKGFLVIQYTRGKVGLGHMEITSVLWPTANKWHRWLVLSYASGADKLRPAAPMLLVMDASEKPDVEKMAAAAKGMMGSLRAEWIGGKISNNSKNLENSAKPISPASGKRSAQPAGANR